MPRQSWAMRAATPAPRQDRRPRPDTVPVVAERLVERRLLADRAVNEIARVFIIRRIEVDFLRHQEIARRVRHRAEDRLTADDHPRRLSCDRAGRAQHVLQLIALHDKSPTARAASGSRRMDRSGAGAATPRSRQAESRESPTTAAAESP